MKTIKRRLCALEGKSGIHMDSAQIEADAKTFMDQIANIGSQCQPSGLAELESFRDAILASRDPFLLHVFCNVEYGDWNL